MPRCTVLLIVLLAAVALTGASALVSSPAQAAPHFQDTATPLPSATPTNTPPPTASSTPPYLIVFPIDGGGELWFEGRWSMGELAVFLAVVAFTGLWTLRWLYALGTGKG